VRTQGLLGDDATASGPRFSIRPAHQVTSHFITRSRSFDLAARDTSVLPAARPRRVREPDAATSGPKRHPPADKVLQSFNTWAFKREQPSDPQLMLRTVADAMASGEPISFVLYWGKGPRCGLGEPDIECLDYLAALAGRVREAYAPGTAITLIFTDTHAELNGHAGETTASYFAAVDAAARQRGFQTCRLSELVSAHAATASADRIDDVMPADMVASLATSAMKWYRGDGTAEDGAARYFRMNMVEKRAVEAAFARSIFITFSSSKIRVLFPQALPIFYMYSLRRGMGVKPWFLPNDAAFCDRASCRCGA
jgi:L-tyrosine isonitrile synthase